MGGLPLKTVRTDTGCYVSADHKMNRDGYWRIHLRSRAAGLSVLRMAHRLVWESLFGPIPDDYEIDHLCNNRGCVNPAHLRCIPGGEHAVHTNSTRYTQRAQSIKAAILSGTPAETIAKTFSISASSVYAHRRSLGISRGSLRSGRATPCVA